MHRALHVCLKHAIPISVRTAFKIRNQISIQTRYVRIRNAWSNGAAAKSNQGNNTEIQVEIHTTNKIDTSKRCEIENVQGGYLPLVVAVLSALGAFLVGVAAVANAAVVYHHGEKKVEEERRHNVVTEQTECGRHLQTEKSCSPGKRGAQLRLDIQL